MNWEKHDLGSIAYYERQGKECTVVIEQRPGHCDRGRWIAKLFPAGMLALSIDEQDMWPRYYFKLDNAFEEVEAWMKRRGQI